MDSEKMTYRNEFFEGHPNLPPEEMRIWIEENKRKKKIFVEYPTIKNLTRRDIWEDRAKFYFLPFLFNCYKFTRKNELPHFAIPVSPTCMFYRDRLHLRNFMDTIHRAFFRCLDMCIPKGEKIMLLVEKRFHIDNPVDGGTQQLYNMLWECDLRPLANKVILPPRTMDSTSSLTSRMGIPLNGHDDLQLTNWDRNDLNPDMPMDGLELCRRTLWLQDDLNFLCRRYDLVDEFVSTEIIDTEGMSEDRAKRWEKTARQFHFKVFDPKPEEGGDDEYASSDSDLDDLDDDDFDFDSTGSGMLDSTLDFEEDEEEMKKIIAFFAKMPKVTGLVQGMLDMMTSLARILPLVIVKLDDEDSKKLKDSLQKTIDIINLGIGKILKICAYLGIKVQMKSNAAIGEIVKNRFKKDKKDFLEYEIDELNKSLDALEKVDEEPVKPPKGQIPLDVKPNHLYPQKMPLRPPMPPPPIVVPPDPPKVEVKPEPPKPPKPPKPEVDSSGSEIKPPPPPIPSVKPEPPPKPPKGANGIK